MTFLWPKFLWLLVLVPVLIGAYRLILARKKKFAVRYSNFALIREALGTGQRLRRHLPPALVLLGLVAGILAIARPTALVTLPSEQRTIILAIDVSLSMRAGDVEPTRIAAAQSAAKSFVQDQPSDVRIGIVSFAGTAALVQPPTRNRDDLVGAIDRFELQRNTAIGSGMLLSLATLFPDEGIDPDPYATNAFNERGRGTSLDRAGKEQPKKQAKVVPPGSYQNGAIILLTDGRRTMGPDPVQVAQMAADHGVRIYTVGFGTPGGANADVDGMSIYMRFDEETLKAIAEITRAQYFYAGSAADLRKIYDTLNARFVLEKKDTEISSLAAALAVVFLVVGAGLSIFWSNRVV